MKSVISSFFLGCISFRGNKTTNASSIKSKIFDFSENAKYTGNVLWPKCNIFKGDAISSYQFIGKGCHSRKAAEMRHCIIGSFYSTINLYYFCYAGHYLIYTPY